MKLNRQTFEEVQRRARRIARDIPRILLIQRRHLLEWLIVIVSFIVALSVLAYLLLSKITVEEPPPVSRGLEVSVIDTLELWIEERHGERVAPFNVGSDQIFQPLIDESAVEPTPSPSPSPSSPAAPPVAQ